jgi:hypothetical protein
MFLSRFIDHYRLFLNRIETKLVFRNRHEIFFFDMMSRYTYLVSAHENATVSLEIDAHLQ